MTRLCDAGYTVLLETSGAVDIAPVDPRAHVILDVKCPGSGMIRSDALAESLSADQPKTKRSLCWPTEPTMNGRVRFLPSMT